MKIKKTKNLVHKKILNYMRIHCYGFRAAATRDKILYGLKISENLDISDRTFRRFFSELRKENLVASHNSDPKGYWMPLLHTNDPEEILALKKSWAEKRSKALSLLEDANRQIDNMDARMSNKVDLFEGGI